MSIREKAIAAFQERKLENETAEATRLADQRKMHQERLRDLLSDRFSLSPDEVSGVVLAENYTFDLDGVRLRYSVRGKSFSLADDEDGLYHQFNNLVGLGAALVEFEERGNIDAESEQETSSTHWWEDGGPYHEDVSTRDLNELKQAGIVFDLLSTYTYSYGSYDDGTHLRHAVYIGKPALKPPSPQIVHDGAAREAVKALKFYFKRDPSKEWNSDNDAEIEYLVYQIIRAAVALAKAED